MPVFQLTEKLIFPPPEMAEENGLLAIGGDLSTERLLLAYSKGIFPWYSQGEPILWWSPSPRLVIFPAEFKVPKRLARFIKQQKYKVTMDYAFQQVITSCAYVSNRQAKGTWIDEDMIEAYTRLHEQGWVHSVECWQDEELVGGLYGIALGRIFFGESMFSLQSNTSKVALVFLVEQLKKWDFDLIDCQLTTEHLLQFGAREIPGSEFQTILAQNTLDAKSVRLWRLDFTKATLL
jgi:leucyl/phenylalanyl-tRNA--protein transferase